MGTDADEDLILAIYEAVSQPTAWQGILDRICDTVSARGCIIFEWHGVGEDRSLITPHYTSGYEADILAGYLQRHRDSEEKDQDLFERQLLSVDGIEVMDEDILLSRDKRYFDRPHVQELAEYGIRYRTGSLLDKDNPYRSRFTLQLSDGQGPLVGHNLEVLKNLLPHVAKALDVGRSLAIQNFQKSALNKIMDRLSVGICLVDTGGRVALTNLEFQRQREEYDVYPIDASGRLKLHRDHHGGNFSKLTECALNHGQFGARPRKEAISVSSADGNRTLCLEVIPLRRSEMLGSAAFDGAMIVSRDTSRPMNVDLELIGRVYGDLTGAELSVIQMICQGLTNSEIAERRERSVATINAQVKSILGKAGANNRTQLLRLLGNFTLPDMLAPDFQCEVQHPSTGVIPVGC